MFSYLKSFVVGSETDQWPTGSFWRLSENNTSDRIFVDALIKCNEIQGYSGSYEITVVAFASSLADSDNRADGDGDDSVYTFPIKMGMCLQETTSDERDVVSWYSLQRRGEKYAFKFDDDRSKPTTINYFKDLLFRMLATDYVHLPLDAVAQLHVDETKEQVAKRIREEKEEHLERIPLATSHSHAIPAEEANESEGRSTSTRTPTPPTSTSSNYDTGASYRNEQSSSRAQTRVSSHSPPTRTSDHKAAYPSAHEPATPASSSYQPLHTQSSAQASTSTRLYPSSDAPAYTPPVYQPLGVYRAEGVSVYECEGALFAFDAGIQKFVEVISQAQNVISSLSENRLRLDIYKGSQLWYRQTPNMKMNLYPLKAEQMIVWNGSRKGVDCSFGWKFAKAIDFRKWQYKIYGAFLAQLNAESAKKAVDEEADDYDYVMALGGFDPMEIDEPEEYGALSESDEESDTDDLLNDSFWNNQGEKNTGLAVGFNTNRTFVKNRAGIDVLKTNDEGDMENVTTLGSNQFRYNGKSFSANNMMLHKGDQQMLLYDPLSDDKSIYRMDLNRGEVVEEWKTHDDIGVNVLAPSTKYGQRTDTDTLVGLNKNRLMVVDGRLAGAKVVEEKSQSYKTAPLLSCLHTTDDGGVVVGSETGEIRMFDRVGIRAKTLLPGFGEAIIGIDVSADGKHILATCENYLLFIPTTFTDLKSGSEVTGINKAMGKHKPKPTVLKLRPDHVQLMNSTVDFTPARFNIGESKEEMISVSSGQYVVQWNLSDVANGITDNYVIKKYKDSVIGDLFVYNDPDKVVVALTNDVTMSKKQMFKKPQTLFSKEKGGIPTRNSVVRSPY